MTVARKMSGGNPVLLGDKYPTLKNAYSVRKLRTAYTGYAIKVRRSSDNAEADIGFVGENLDTAALLAHCGAGNGFVTTWYDQSGNGKNVTQATAGNQPQIVSSGALLTDNGRPTLRFDGSATYLGAATASDWVFLHYGTANSAFVVARAGNVTDPELFYALYSTSLTVTDVTGAYLAHDTRSSGSRDRQLVHVVGNSGIVTLNAQSAGDTPANVLFQASVIGKPGDATAANRSAVATNNGSPRQNNVDTTEPSNSAPKHALYVGAGQNASNTITAFLLGAVSELIFYDSDQSANRSAIYTNQANYYAL